MHVMGSVSPANEREAFSFEADGVAAVVQSSPPSPAPLRSFDLKGNHSAPPPPPPPPPPPFAGPAEPEGRNQKKKRVRSFFWKAIPEEQVKGRPNLWTQGREQQQYQIDIHTVEELFGQNDCQTESKATLSRGGNRSSLRETREEVSILDSKRGMNIGIFLKQFKKSTQMIIDDVCNGNSEPYGAEPLRELLKLLPDPDEVKKLKAFTGDVSKLPMADSFVYQLVLLPSYSVRIESMLLKEEFPAACEAMTRDIGVLRWATKELMCCDELHAVLHLVLQAGNILNAGGYAGNAAGFKLSSLLALADTKANKPGMNLLHFVALEAQKKDEKLLEFPLKLPHIQAAARISIETLDAELQWITGRTHAVEESVQRDTELLQQLDGFLQAAAASLCSLRRGRQQLSKEGSELIDFFCEDRDGFRLDDCFSIFHTFCSRFTRAVKENMEREAREAAYRRRLQQVEEQKRHSWAGGEETVGAFRLHCSSESDMAQHGKAGLLMKPHAPLLWGSLRRSRRAPSDSPSVAAERDLSAFLHMAAHGRKGAQQRGGDTRTAWSLALCDSEPGLSPQTRAQSSKFTLNFPPESQVAPQRTSPRGLRTTNSAKTTSRNLSRDATQAPGDAVKATSDSHQHCDHNNNDHDQVRLGFITPSDPSPSAVSGEAATEAALDCGHGTAAPGTMSVVLETRTLVPELKVFDVTHSSSNRGSHGAHLDDVISDLEGGLDTGREHRVRNPSHTGNAEQREDDKGRAEEVVVWCVTGVCKAAEELTHAAGTGAHTGRQRCRSHAQGGNQRISSVASKPSGAAPADRKPVPISSQPVPISSQPVPVSRCDDLSPHASSPGWSPTKPGSAQEAALTPAASDQGPEPEAGGGEEAEPTAQHTTPANTEPSYTRKRVESSSSKPSTKTRRAQPTAVKPTTTSASKPKPVRTLTSSENQGMRRVVPISRNRTAPSTGTTLEGTTPAGLSPRSASFRRERPSTAPSSRRSSINKAADPKDSREQKASPRHQNQELQRRQSVQRPPAKTTAPPEEKMCRSTLRALTLAGGGGGGGGGGSVSAPVTPLHRGTTRPASPLPGFARSTASSSFRRTSTVLVPKAAPRLDSSPTPSSTAPKPGSCSPMGRTGSLRGSSTSRAADALTPQRSQSIRVRPDSPLQKAPHKGQQRKDTCSFSDQSARSRDSAKTPRATCR